MLEGVPLLGSPLAPNPPLSAQDLVQRFTTDVAPPSGITPEDVQELADGPLTLLFTPGVPDQSGNITTNPTTIASALDIVYDNTNPDCPCYNEGNTISELIIGNLAEVKPGRPSVTYSYVELDKRARKE
jgi:hypothetical protein